MKRYAVSPVNYYHVKKGERYLITEWDSWDRAGSFYIVLDGRSAFCLFGAPCAHLGGLEQWTIVEEEEPSDD